MPRYLVERLLLDTSGYLQEALANRRQRRDADRHGSLADAIQRARERLATAGIGVPAVEAQARYGWVAKVLDGRRDAAARSAW